MSAPHLLGADVSTIPADIPYLHAVPADVTRWRSRLSGRDGLRVGIVWAGDPHTDDIEAAAMDRRRSVTLSRFAALERPGVVFISLQKGQPQTPRPVSWIDVMDDVTDFADTAALVANLDLVIAVDTAVAHLAGAMGKPVWLLSRFDGCWRWPPEQETCSWYPTVRLFHQRKAGDWDEVFSRLSAALAHLLTAGSLSGDGLL